MVSYMLRCVLFGIPKLHLSFATAGRVGEATVLTYRCLDVCMMATLTLEGSADQAENGPLEEGEHVGEGDDILIGEPPGSRAHQPGSCCERCAAIVQAYSKHRYER